MAKEMSMSVVNLKKMAKKKGYKMQVSWVGGHCEPDKLYSLENDKMTIDFDTKQELVAWLNRKG